ncbi:YihY/virulence factor BrkB family protein [cf. Phormidesmis sp. LEGE 11477]|uniref:YihY/virulence factor BrkB family protein n=1 Tax=cf. Phormidesmis sp. LEGE 11477 TaxID=1828680 RepID=UPI00187F1AFA|nr:YihY/virulence factor BrkB family protein [cf. Phormidesmis sp. LEGE 11477]MBE9062581.1 YihY/virulence factor BrkB family protein [cf. Phormidesmis sp. LEGE 11477]
MNPSILWSLLKQTVAEWQRDKVSRLAAALAYYTTFALAPILIIAIAIASFLFEQSTVQSRILEQIQSLLGANAAGVIEEMLTSRSTNDGGFWATIVSVGLLIIGASGLFIQLQDALNTVWNVVAKKDEGIWGLVRDRLLSFGIVLAIGFLLLVSLVVSAGLSAVSGMFSSLLPGWDIAWQILNAALSFGIITLLFGMIYKVLPDVKIAWGDVWTGAAITALLFTIGKALIGLYIGNSSVASAYGAAGSFVVLLLWIYYSSQILLFGAEFTQVYANRFGSNIRPDSHAEFAADATGKEKGKATADDESKLPRNRSEYRAMRRGREIRQGVRAHGARVRFRKRQSEAN